ncbi:MAG TPA: glutamate formimidoyltransferase [Gemmatimonadaceae bacterium]
MLVECVPNFSEARRPEVVAAIRDAIAGDGGIVLDVSSDAWHNRSVITFVAPPERMVAAALAGVREAKRRIDLNAHTGCHPRLGAADVVPLVPLAGVTMDDCVALARELGQRIGTELELPVYLYEYAATRPERRNLADVRRGGFEGLRELVGVDPTRDPDFGPRRLHPTAGAVAVGARDPLVAFNVHLGPASNLPVARAVARAVRHSSGGLRGVKALALEVDGQAQVSMNLVALDLTPMHEAFELVRREAEARGVAVTWSEIVGLVPERELVAAGAQALRLARFTPAQLLERRVREEAGQFVDGPLATE